MELVLRLIGSSEAEDHDARYFLIGSSPSVDNGHNYNPTSICTPLWRYLSFIFNRPKQPQGETCSNSCVYYAFCCLCWTSHKCTQGGGFWSLCRICCYSCCVCQQSVGRGLVETVDILSLPNIYLGSCLTESRMFLLKFTNVPRITLQHSL